ncbi:MAG TPA: lipocalin-like domain-containing protein [Usitatibacter sp.]|jgi:predicted secreted hydrolase|nr:lipocalin-like domain-containing protein [Usitatibacter sp.]
MRRANFSIAAFAALAALFAGAAAFDPVVPGTALQFPRDLGAHPGFRIEWWYVTGHLESAGGPLGFQVTFFRVRNPAAESSPSRFAPRQLLFAHAALADPAAGHLLHGERSARAYDGLAEAKAGETDVRIDDWTLARESGAYRTRIDSEGFALDLVLTPTQPVLLEGDRGFSRKGPLPSQASEYYSEPQLRVAGRVRAQGRMREVTGVAWLDHEWSSEYLAPEAAGWDWLGANLDDGSAVMAFRMRTRDGRVLWSQATVRPRGGAPLSFSGDAVRFRALRSWKSPRTGVAYPISMEVTVGERRWTLEPIMDDQELDARASTGTLYWEGAVRIAGEHAAGGRGYLELTGYADRVPF